MKKLKIFLFVFGLIIGFQILAFLQILLEPKYMDESRDGALIGEYYQEAGDHDVIFVGDCEVYENFVPAVLWEDCGISSCIRGSAQQTVWQSCYLMEETFRYETPKVMVFNVLSMQYDSPESTGDPARREAYNRMTLDGMKWSPSKWRAIKASMTDEERQWQSGWTYVFPILRYHDRWSRLTKDDFRYLFHRDRVGHSGYLMQTGIRPVEGDHAAPPPVNPDFGETSWEYLDKMAAMCKEHGTELVLIKAPSLYPVWWDRWDQQIREYAGENGLRYYNFLECQEKIGLDWQRDTYDTGLHLNVYGAEKLTRYFGGLLDLPDRRDDPELSGLWQQRVDRYYESRQAMGA